VGANTNEAKHIAMCFFSKRGLNDYMQDTIQNFKYAKAAGRAEEECSLSILMSKIGEFHIEADCGFEENERARTDQLFNHLREKCEEIWEKSPL